MKTLYIKGENQSSAIHVGEKLDNIKKYLSNKKIIIITDENVKKYYGSRFSDYPIISIPSGEKIKTISTLEIIYHKLIKIGADRQTFILGIGGGIVCDITGFAASTYMRGVKFGFIATTLLAQVDASIGGKNGVNFNSYKNMLGVFSQPEFVVCDISLLKTLPLNEIFNGFAEIVKYALIKKQEMFEYIESNFKKAYQLDHQVIMKLIMNSIKIKINIVQKDEKETNKRQKLNFGHTIGHALEKITKIEHGRAVSLGMVQAANFSHTKGFISKKQCKQISNLLNKLNLPVSHNINSSLIIDALKKDKKIHGEMINFVFLRKIGNSFIKKISLNELFTFIKKADKHKKC